MFEIIVYESVFSDEIVARIECDTVAELGEALVLIPDGRAWDVVQHEDVAA